MPIDVKNQKSIGFFFLNLMIIINAMINIQNKLYNTVHLYI